MKLKVTTYAIRHFYFDYLTFNPIFFLKIYATECKFKLKKLNYLQIKFKD